MRMLRVGSSASLRSYSEEYGRRSSRYGRQRNYHRRLEFLQGVLRGETGLGLDVGSADGDYAADVQSKGHTVVCLDIDRDSLRRALSRNHVTCIQGSASSFPVADGSVAFVYILNALRVFPDPQRTIVEVARVLHDGGLFFLACHTLLSPDILFAPRENVRYLTPWEIEGMLEEARLEVVDKGHIPSIPPSATPASEDLFVRATAALAKTPVRVFLPEFYFVARKPSIRD